MQNPYFQFAYGHATPVTYLPEPNSIIGKNQSLPSKVIISFSERPDPMVSSIQVLNSDNQRVDNNDFKITGQQHNREAEVTLDTNKLKDGIYTVSWLTMSSDDGHIAKGSYVFGIGNVGGSQPSTNVPNPSGPINLTNNENNAFLQKQTTTEAVTSTLDGIMKWPIIVSQIAIVGGIISHIFFWKNDKLVNKILLSTKAEDKINRNNRDTAKPFKGVKHKDANTDIDNNIYDASKQTDKLRFKPLQIFVTILCTSSLVIIVFGTALLFLQINNLSNPGSNYLSLFGTLIYDSVGIVWILRILTSIVVIAASLSYYVLEKRNIKRKVKENYENQKIRDDKNIIHKNRNSLSIYPLYFALVGGAICVLANSMTSHNSGIDFLPSVAISLDWLHFMAVSTWVGGLFYVSTVLFTLVKSHILDNSPGIDREIKEISRMNPYDSRKGTEKVMPYSEDSKKGDHPSGSIGEYFLALLLPRFSLLATISLGIIGVSGLYMAWIHLHTFNALFDTPYGNILVVKLVTVLPLILLGVYHQLQLHNYMITIASNTRRSSKKETTSTSALKEDIGYQSPHSNVDKVSNNDKFFNIKKKFFNRENIYSKSGENRTTGKNYTSNIYSRFSKTIKIESLLGIAVLFVASILTITSPPSMNMSSSMMMTMMDMNGMNVNMMHPDQHNSAEDATTTSVMLGKGGSTSSSDSVNTKNLNTSPQKIVNNSYTQEAKILDTNEKIEISPFYTGFNTFKVTFSDKDGKPAKNISNVIMRFTNDEANIGPIAVNLDKTNDGVYSTFGGYLSQQGNWNIKITAQRIGAYDLNYEFDSNVEKQPPSNLTASPLSSANTFPPSTQQEQQQQQQQKSPPLSGVGNDNKMNPPESLPSFDSFALLTIVLSALVIFGSVYSFKKSKQQLKETIDVFEDRDKEQDQQK
jgi:putative copper export protein/methionine-rich copper-binding protein CopC